jgi:2-dehydro-3-deoxygalactonokinase
MSAENLLITGDWGTTKLRLCLCQGTTIVDRTGGLGVGATDGDFQAQYRALTADWIHRYGPIPAILCGAIGSRNGWVETDYVECPVNADDLGAKIKRFDVDGGTVGIVPGLSCTNPLASPDVMRSEETQILGMLRMHPETAREPVLVLLPGTHTKWVHVDKGRIETFLTVSTGEIFALLRDYSSMGRAGNGALIDSREAFRRGLARQIEVGPALLIHLVFESRSRQLSGELTRSEAMAYLSGLLVAADTAGGLLQFPRELGVYVIGDPSLTELYAEALAFQGVDSTRFDGGACALAGLRALYDAAPY